MTARSRERGKAMESWVGTRGELPDTKVEGGTEHRNSWPSPGNQCIPGTVTTAFVIFSFKNLEASSTSFLRTCTPKDAGKGTRGHRRREH